MKVKIADIKVGERFRKDYGNIEELAASIRRYGLLHPIVVTRDLELVAGERRLRACMLLGMEEIEVRFLDEVDELERKEIELEENIKRKQFTWQEEVAAKKALHELKQKMYGKAVPGHGGGWGLAETAEALGMSIGSVAMDIELARALEVMPELAKEKNKSAAYKKLKKLKERAILKEMTRRAIERGESPVEGAILGDCVVEMAKMPDESVDLIITDPPWGIGIDKESLLSRESPVEYEDDEASVMEMLDAAFREMFRVLRNNSHCYVFFGIAKYPQVLAALRRAGFEVDPIPLIWDKGSGGGPSTGWTYVNAYETIFHCWKGRRQLNGAPTNVLRFDRVPPRQRIHSAQKPVALIRELIEQSSLPGDTVLDPFAGSGSVGVAARQARRRAILIEKDPATFAAMCERLAGGEDDGDNSNGTESA